jgi:hypothetical protein
MSRFRRGACALAALACFACNQKKDTAAPPPTGMPPLDEPAAAGKPDDHPTHEPSAAAPGASTLPPGHPPLPATGGDPHAGLAGGTDPHAGGATTGGAFAGETPGGDFDPSTVISGVIKIDAKVKDKVKPGDTIFLVARRYEEGSTAPGTPLAVRKLTVGTWPLPFSVDSRDAMLVGTKLAGKVIVTVRVDKDGDAITKNPGDVTGQSKPLEPPSKNVVVQLDTLL